MTKQFRIELSEEEADRLASLAAFRDTTPERLLADVARGLMANADALNAWIAEGGADARAGRVVPADQVFAELDEIIAAARARRGG